MLPLLAGFLPMLPSLRAVKIGLAIAALIVAFGAGVTVTKAYYKRGEVAAYKAQVERERKQAQTDQATLKGFYESQLKIATRPKVVKNEIVNLLPADCQLGADVIGLLNSHRADLPETSPGTADRSWLRWPDSR